MAPHKCIPLVLLLPLLLLLVQDVAATGDSVRGHRMRGSTPPPRQGRKDEKAVISVPRICCQPSIPFVNSHSTACLLRARALRIGAGRLTCVSTADVCAHNLI